MLEVLEKFSAVTEYTKERHYSGSFNKYVMKVIQVFCVVMMSSYST